MKIIYDLVLHFKKKLVWRETKIDILTKALDLGYKN